VIKKDGATSIRNFDTLKNIYKIKQKNMKRIFCCLLLLTFLYQSEAQSRSETIQWLSGKFDRLAGVQTKAGFRDQSNNKWYNFWNLSTYLFLRPDTSLYVQISNKLLTTSDYQDLNNYSIYSIPLNKLSRVEFTSIVNGETLDSPAFIFHTFGQDISTDHLGTNRGKTSSAIVPLDVISEDNLGERLKKAFDNLIALNQPKQAF